MQWATGDYGSTGVVDAVNVVAPPRRGQCRPSQRDLVHPGPRVPPTIPPTPSPFPVQRRRQNRRPLLRTPPCVTPWAFPLAPEHHRPSPTAIVCPSIRPLGWSTGLGPAVERGGIVGPEARSPGPGGAGVCRGRVCPAVHRRRTSGGHGPVRRLLADGAVLRQSRAVGRRLRCALRPGHVVSGEGCIPACVRGRGGGGVTRRLSMGQHHRVSPRHRV